MKYCKCLPVVLSTQPRIFRHSAGMAAFFSILLAAKLSILIMYATGVPEMCSLPASFHTSHASLDD